MVTKVPASLVAADVATQAELDAEGSARTAAILAGNVKLTGDVVQVVNTQSGALSTSVTVMPLDDTIPQITEGTEILTRSITPTNASNILEIEVILFVANNSGVSNVVGLFQDSTANALAAGAVASSSNAIAEVAFKHRMVAGTTSATTFRVRGGPSTAVTMTINGVNGARLLGGVLASSITVTEYKV